MTKHIPGLRLLGFVTRTLFVVFFFYAVWMVLKTVTGQQRLINDFVIGAGTVLNWFIPGLVMWITSVLLYAFADMIQDIDKIKRYLASNSSRKNEESGTERFALPRPPVRDSTPQPRPVRSADQYRPPANPARAADQYQPPRPKIENKPKLTSRLYTIRWQGKAPRSVKRQGEVSLD
jgi:hypothetical protein